jgi:hypothetical protein
MTVDASTGPIGVMASMGSSPGTGARLAALRGVSNIAHVRRFSDRSVEDLISRVGVDFKQSGFAVRIPNALR